MTTVYITIDTEYSVAHARQCSGGRQSENFDRSIAGVTPSGAYGIHWQMDVFERFGLQAVFFVDPMPALIWGVDSISRIVMPILDRGHDVQLHLHTEWLELAGSANPLGGRTGWNIKDFTFEEQCVLIEYARDVLMQAGAQAPVAFRAGNYGANDDTVRALAALGIAYDTSHCPGIVNSHCAIALGQEDLDTQLYLGTTEVPIGCIAAFNNGLRHYQLTALSYYELVAALQHAIRNDQLNMTLVSHSFEILSRDRQRCNKIVANRFERYCKAVAEMTGLSTGTYAQNPPQLEIRHSSPLPFSVLRTGYRFIEQAIGNTLYGAK